MESRHKVLFVVALVGSFCIVPQLGIAFGQEPVEVTVQAMLVNADLDIKPVPKTVFDIVADADPDLVIASVTTSFSGEAKVNLNPGKYRIKSKAPTRLQDTNYNWEVPFEVIAGNAMTIELSNDNANSFERGGVAPDVFRATKNAVFTLEVEGGHGTAFLVDERGLLLTNHHVVEGSRFFAIRSDDGMRYSATLVFSNPTEDIAVVSIHPEVAESMSVLNLAPDSPEHAPLVEGEQVFAVGSPLNQETIISAGIVSKVERGAIISDVMIDHGNSGGPLLSNRGEVVGINTFGEGLGISGIIRIWKAFPVLEEARTRLSGMTRPSATPLPSYPETRYPADALREIVLSKTFRLSDYVLETRPFNVIFLTPPAMTYTSFRTAIEASKGRKKRRKRDDVESTDTFDPVRIQGWRQYVGDLRAMVTIQVEPKAKLTGGSKFLSGLAAFGGGRASVKYKFAGDFDSITLKRGGVEVPFIRVQRVPRTKLFSTGYERMSDVAYVGLVEYLPDAFEPPAPGEDIVLEIINEAKPDKTVRVKIPKKILERIWQDFAPLRVPASVNPN